MIDATLLGRAIDLHERAYQLFLWLKDAVARGFIRPGTAHHYASATAVAVHWIREHFDNLPPAGRPPSRDAADLEDFARMFSTFLLTSFDYDATPGTRRVSACGCYCQICSRIEAAPHLRLKRATKATQQHALSLKRNYLARHADALGRTLTFAEMEALLGDAETDDLVALAAYAEILIDRMRGTSPGPGAWLLWRQFTKRARRPRSESRKLGVEEVLVAEQTVRERLAA